MYSENIALFLGEKMKQRKSKFYWKINGKCNANKFEEAGVVKYATAILALKKYLICQTYGIKIHV